MQQPPAVWVYYFAILQFARWGGVTKEWMLMLLKITTVGESVLRQQARPLTVAEIRSAEIQQLIQHMRETVNDAPGVGLAAPQVGFPLQLAVIEDKQEYFAGLTAEQIAARERQPVPFHVIINPVLQLQSAADVEFFEGCLSVPGFTAIVPRSRQVRVDCLDETGAPQIIEASGWYARILQHEVDHLHGTLYLDRMQSRTFCSLDVHARLWKNKTTADVKRVLG
jgi:peptide deformylase